MGTCSQSPFQILLFRFSNIHYTVQCGSVLPVQITRAGYLAILCFQSLLTLISFLLLVTWGWGSARVPPGYSFVSYPFH